MKTSDLPNGQPKAAEAAAHIPGIELSRSYFEEYGLPALNLYFGEYMDQITAGLVGEGSECFGFDDALSADHDYGPSFCIWLSQDLYDTIGPELGQMYDSLPREYQGVRFQLRREQASQRRGILPTMPFYQRFLGRKLPPETPMEWLSLPEEYLAVATNGVLFHSPDTEFVRIRRQLLGFYPEDVRKKKLAANLIRMAHAGQVNYERMSRRGDPVAARLALDQFIQGGMKTLYLLNMRYAPYYKWMWRGMEKLPRQCGIPAMLSQLAQGNILECEKLLPLVEEVSGCFVTILLEQGHTASNDNFLERQAYYVMQTIEDPRIQNLPIMMG